MVGAIVIALVAAVVMLLAGVAVMAGRLVTGGRGLRGELERTRDRVQPMVTELGENFEIARIESQAVQASMDALRNGAGRSGADPHLAGRGRYTAGDTCRRVEQE